MENLAKPKRKTKSAEAPLVWQSNYEFVVPYNMDECIRRINTLGNKYWNEKQELWRFFFPSDNFGVDSQEDNGAVFNFKISGSQHKGTLTAQLIGSLIYESNQQTRVKIQTGFTRSSVIELVIILPIMSIIFVLATHATNSFEILVAFGISFAFFSLIAFFAFLGGYPIKSQLYYDLRNALIPSKASRPQTLPP